MILFGAFTYGELAAVFLCFAGEYNLLSKIYHLVLGFLSGWISVTVGFASPAIFAAIVFKSYPKTVFTLKYNWFSENSLPVTNNFVMIKSCYYR